jgi:pimeloyl-ACP methyl ester carboxylesterase
MTGTTPESSFIVVNRVRLHVQDWGGTGAPIVLLHATGFLGCIYRPIAERLTAIGHVYSYDQRGHGDSSPSSDGQYNWQINMDDLEAFITAMGWRGIRAWGHSSGATAIGSLAAKRPDLISRAVLAEPVVFESPEAPELEWRNPFVERTLKRKAVFDSTQAMFENFAKKPPYETWRKDILRDYCEYGTGALPDGKRELKCSPQTEAQIYQSARDFDGLHQILASETQMLIMFGQNSDSLGITLSGKISKQLNNGHVVEVPGAGHLLAMEKPDYIADLSIEFLSAN